MEVSNIDKSSHQCKNCDNSFIGKFCNSCGQSSETHKINFHYIVHEIQHSVFHVDGGMFYTIKELIKRPGNTIREFIEGKRVKHFKPAVFVIVLSLIYSFLEHYNHNRTYIEDFLSGILSGIKNPENQQGSNLVLSFIDWLISHYAYTTLLMIPLFSLCSYLAFIKSKYNYFEHMVLNAYIFGQVTFFFILFYPFSLLFPQSSAVDILKITIGAAFLIWTYFQFFNTLKKRSRILNSITAYFLFGLIMIFILTILSVLSYKL